MIIEYKLGLEHYLVNQLYIASKSPRVNKQRRINRFVVPLINILIAIVSYFNKDYIFSIIILTISFFWFLYYPRYSRKQYIKHYSNHLKENQSQIFGKSTYASISENYLKINDEHNELKLSVMEISKIIELSDIYLINLQSGGNIIIPKSETDSKTNEFINILTSKFKIELVSETDWQWK